MNVINSNGCKYNIILVGCGGTGGQLLPSLMQLCQNLKSRINRITLVDGDYYEEHNMLNQRCLEDEIGMNKAEALAERWGYIYEDLNITYYSDYIRCVKDAINVIGRERSTSYDPKISIVIGAVDRNSTRKLLHETFNLYKDNKQSLIYIDSGNGDVNRVGQIITGYTDNGVVYSRPVADYFTEILEDKEDLTKLTNCTTVMKEHPQNIATNVFAASILFSVITNIVTFGKIEKGVIYFDANKHTVVSR